MCIEWANDVLGGRGPDKYWMDLKIDSSGQWNPYQVT
jgi:hypothetical protein